MKKLSTLYFLFMQYLCTIFIGMCIHALIDIGYDINLILSSIAMFIASLIWHILYLRARRNNSRFKVIELTSESEKPADIPDEVWVKMRELMDVANVTYSNAEENDDDVNHEE